MEDSEDFEDERVKSSYIVREGYRMKISEEWFESNRIKMFMISLNKKNEIGVDEALDVEQQVKLIGEGDDELEDEENTEKEESEMGQIVGTMKAFLVDRSGGGNFNFWCECDSINEDIYIMINIYSITIFCFCLREIMC